MVCGGGPTFVLGSAALQGRETSGNNLPFPLISQQWFLLPESLSFRLDGAPVWGLPYRGTEACQEYVQPLLWMTPPDRFSSSMMISRCARW